MTEQTPRVLEEVIWRDPGNVAELALQRSGHGGGHDLRAGAGECVATVMVAKSICGSEETGRLKKASIPASAIATVSSVVATGRVMKRAEMFMRR